MRTESIFRRIIYYSPFIPLLGFVIWGVIVFTTKIEDRKNGTNYKICTNESVFSYVLNFVIQTLSFYTLLNLLF